MATLTAPGVYVEEVSSGVRPIQAAGTSTAAFFGEAERGPIGSVVKIFNFTEFQTSYGAFLDGGRYLAHAVFQFFNNGGAACYVGRVAPGAQTASVTVLDRGAAAQDSITFRASSPGAWGNRVMVVVSSAASTDPENQFTLNVFQDNPVAGEPPVLLETFADLSMNPADPAYVERVVNSRSTYLRAAVNAGNGNLARGFSRSAEIDVDGNDLLGLSQREFRINVNGDGFRTVDLTAALAAADLADPADIRQAVQDVLRAMTPLRQSTPANSYSGIDVEFNVTTAPDGELRIVAGGAASAASSVLVQDATDPTRNAAGLLGLGTRNGGTEVSGSAPLRPQNTPAGDFYFLGDDTVAGPVSAVQLGDDGSTPQDQDFIAAFSQLDTVRDVSLLAVPGVGSEAVVDAGMNYCARRHLSDCFFIGDMEATDDTYVEAVAFRDTLNNPNSYGAVYFPWLRMLDPTGVSPEPIPAPPSGFVAGLYGRIDSRRGVWKAPAGTEAILAGAVGLTTELGEVQHGDLNNHPKSVCVIRRFPAAGIVAWGARTVSSDPEYRYVPVRRMAIFLRVSIYDGIQWAVFEPNDEPLWASLRLNIGAFMNTLFRRGAFQGASPSEAYFVKCDAETTTQADIDLGIVNVLVGFAPLKPAEFVVVRISQKAGQTG
ncbi:MAG TPA: phage tail sheath C-terminal domain-containing protein [Longimicrobiaceae bacterium]|nr:phage tail sheath C-terminal domain-containing protein [Longimicrobiaceae bacterium]